MDKDTVKGTVDDAVGRAKRQVGEWTGDTNAQVEGTAQQVKGKVEKAWGNTKDAVRDVHEQAKEDLDKTRKREDEDRIVAEREREKERGKL